MIAEFDYEYKGRTIKISQDGSNYLTYITGDYGLVLWNIMENGRGRDEMKSKQLIWQITQSAFAIFSAYSIMPYLVIYGWDTLIHITKFLEKMGMQIKLVGEAGSFDPGAVIVAGLYVLIGILLGWTLNRTKLRTFGIMFCVSTIFLSYIVFGMVSSMIWF